MNWEAISAIADLLAATTIVVSLVYVAIQLRLNTQQMSHNLEVNKLMAFEHNVSSGNRVRELLLLNPDLMILLTSAMRDYSSLNKLEKQRFNLLMRNILSEYQGAFIRQMLFDDAVSETSIHAVDEFLSNAEIRSWIKKRLPKFDWRPEFSTFVAGRITLLEASCAEAKISEPQ